MKLTLILAIGLFCCAACNSPKQSETVEVKDTTIAVVDTVAEENYQVETTTSTTTYDTASEDELVEENGEIVYVSKNQYSFISDPYDFYLGQETIEGLLGEEAETNVQEFEAGEDYSAYTYTTITFGDTKISFFDFTGKHFSNITTPLLPLKNGIKIGMKKADFLSAMGFDGPDAPKAGIYRLVDDYGSMEFSFRADTLHLIYDHYEEGD